MELLLQHRVANGDAHTNGHRAAVSETDRLLVTMSNQLQYAQRQTEIQGEIYKFTGAMKEGLTEQQRLIISVISVVAVLVANVSFLGYVTPPGGTHPYWEACHYDVYVWFLICNGLAFLFSLGATGVVVFLPWLYPPDKTEKHQKMIGYFILAGMLLLVLAIITFTVAFGLAGLVTGGYKAEKPECGVLPCERGGVSCSPSVQDGSMTPILSLNKVYGECFWVSQVASGSVLWDKFTANKFDTSRMLLYRNNSVEGSLRLGAYENPMDPDIVVKGTKVDFNRSTCYLEISKVDSLSPDKYTNKTRNVLCNVGLVPGNPDVMAASKARFEDILVNMTQALWSVPPGNGSTAQFYLQIPQEQSTTGPLCDKDCVCSETMQKHQKDLVFVTYAPKEQLPQLYLASIRGPGEENINLTASKGLNSSHIRSPAGLGQDLILYNPSVFFRRNVAVYDELRYRCSNTYNASQPTMCKFASNSSLNAPKWYQEAPGKVPERRCGSRLAEEAPKKVAPGQTGHTVKASVEKDHPSCTGLAVDNEGKYIMISKLADFGSEVVYDDAWIGEQGQSTGMLAFVIMYLGLGLLAVIFACLAVVRIMLCCEGPGDGHAAA